MSENFTYPGDDLEIEEHEGYRRGDRIVFLDDNEDEGYYMDDEATVMGFERIVPSDPVLAAKFGTSERTAIMVQIDGYDEPIEARPVHIQKIG